MSVYVCLPACLPACLLACLHACPSACMHVHLPACMSTLRSWQVRYEDGDEEELEVNEVRPLLLTREMGEKAAADVASW